MRAYLHNWAYEKFNNLPSWWKENSEKDKEPREVSWEQIQELYETGANVMLYPAKEDDDVKSTIIFIDTKRFTTR